MLAAPRPAPPGLQVHYGPHSVVIDGVPVRRFQEQPWWWTVLTNDASPGVSLLRQNVRAVGGTWRTRFVRVQIGVQRLGIGPDAWPLSRVVSTERAPRSVWVWIRLDDGRLRRYGLAHGWPRADRRWLASVLHDALDQHRANRAPTPPPALLRLRP